MQKTLIAGMLLFTTILFSFCAKTSQDKIVGEWKFPGNENTLTFSADHTVMTPDGKHKWELLGGDSLVLKT